MDSTREISIQELRELFADGIIGQLEFRSWLERLFPDFAEVRNPELDGMIRERAKEYERLIKRQRDLAFRRPDDGDN